MSTRATYRVAIETSSLLPLVWWTSYTYPLYFKLGAICNAGGEIVVHSDSIEEAKQTAPITKTASIVEKMQMFHRHNNLSFLRSVLEFFPGSPQGNNSARGVALFVLDVLDSIPDELSYTEFEQMLRQNLLRKIDAMLGLLEPRDSKIAANPALVQSYWHPRNLWTYPEVGLSDLPQLEIVVRSNMSEPKSRNNRDRDVFHHELAVNDGDIDELVVCDGSFTKQIEKARLDRLPVCTLQPVKLSQMGRTVTA